MNSTRKAILDMTDMSQSHNSNIAPVIDLGGLRARRSVLLVSLIWLCAVLAAAAVSIWTNSTGYSLLPFAAAAILPAVLGIVLYPVMHREWAQICVMFAWIALAVIATFAIAFVPMAFLFLCAPAAAALFKREMVIEAMVLSALAAGGVFYLSRWGLAPELVLPDSVKEWGRVTAPAATIVFMIGSMFAVANSRTDYAEPSSARTDGDILNAYPGAAFRTDDEGHILFASDTAKFLLGQSATSLYGQPLSNALTNTAEPDINVSNAIDAALFSGETQVTEVEAIFTDTGVEEVHHLRLSITPTSGDGAYIYAADITPEQAAIKALSTQQDAAQKDAQGKSLFFAGVSHELRTPLNAIIGFSDMMRSRLFGPLPGKYAEYADLIHDSGQHMLDLIGDVLDISKIEAGKYDLTYDRFDLADVVRSSLKMIGPSADASNVQLLPDIEDDLPIMLSADRRAVRQILLNLLSNAIKFTPKGGQISVFAGAERDLEGHLTNRIVLRVSDNGVGMSAAEITKANKAYVQTASAQMTDQRGTGLGLSLVQSLVDLHDGAMDIQSVPREGTQVTITLPSERDEDHNQAANDEADQEGDDLLF